MRFFILSNNYYVTTKMDTLNKAIYLEQITKKTLFLFILLFKIADYLGDFSNNKWCSILPIKVTVFFKPLNNS